MSSRDGLLIKFDKIKRTQYGALHPFLASRARATSKTSREGKFRRALDPGAG